METKQSEDPKGILETPKVGDSLPESLDIQGERGSNKPDPEKESPVFFYFFGFLILGMAGFDFYHGHIFQGQLALGGSVLTFLLGWIESNKDRPSFTDGSSNLPLTKEKVEESPPSDDVAKIDVKKTVDIPLEVTQEGPVAIDFDEPEIPLPAENWLTRLTRGLGKTRSAFVSKIQDLFTGKTSLDKDILSELEEILYESDMGDFAQKLLLELEENFIGKGKSSTRAEVFDFLKSSLKARLEGCSGELVSSGKEGLKVILVVGVNGVGKTTSIGKMARHFRKEGQKVMLAAADTFRAAAMDQLEVWAKRAGVSIVKGREGGDPGAVVFDALASAQSRKYDILIIDTAGRLHTKNNLMEEMKKIYRIIKKEIPEAPHETLLVVDSTTGQNALMQAKSFSETLDSLSGIILTKLDGTAKGGIIFSINQQLKIPVKLIGIGEGIDDLRPFVPGEFIEGLFGQNEKG